MASQPPVQYNQMQPAIPNAAGISQPPRFQHPSASNGIGQQTTGSTFPLPSSTNYAPVLSNPASSQWARPPISGQSAPSPISQSSFTTTSQQCNPAVPGQISSRPILQPLNSARPPIVFAMNQQSSGKIHFFPPEVLMICL
jgi:hypothetical protein